MLTETPTAYDADSPKKEVGQSQLAKVLATKNLRHELDFFRLRFRQMGIDPESIDETHLSLHIATIATMFDAHCERPYDD